jgi:ABC-type Fe3+-hydroxamate transport system substrate-binding protein
MTIRHTLIAALATAALVSPAAQAQTPDMHASTAEAAAKARALTESDGGGSPDAPAAQAPQRSGSTPGANRDDLASPQPLAGQPTRQTNPTTPSASDDGSPVPVLPILAGVLGMLIAALTAHYGVRRSSRRRRIAA